MIAVRAHQHHPPLGIADDRGEARAVTRDLDTAKSRFGFFAEPDRVGRSEEHTSELQSLMRISYAVFCLKKTRISIRSLNRSGRSSLSNNSRRSAGVSHI